MCPRTCLSISASSRPSTAHDEVLRQIDATRADLLVLGTHGRSGFQRLFLGSVTEKVIRKATCPTLVVPPRASDVPPDAPVRFRRILCPIDFSESSLSALAYALNVAEEAAAHLTLLHVIEMPPGLRENPLAPDFDVDRIHAAAEADARRRLRDLVPDQARTYCAVETDVVDGRAYRRVLQRAVEEETDLIVMGVHGRGAVDLLVFGYHDSPCHPRSNLPRSRRTRLKYSAERCENPRPQAHP